MTSQSLTGLTDNKGNAHAVAKMLTTKFPLCAILMEIAATMEQNRMPLSLYWIPREQNVEADELSNEDSKRFSPILEIKIDVAGLKFIVLDELLDKGEALYQLVEKHKAAREPGSAPPKKLQRKPEQKLRATHPW